MSRKSIDEIVNEGMKKLGVKPFRLPYRSEKELNCMLDEFISSHTADYNQMNVEQKKNIISGFENGLSMEEVEVYGKSFFDNNQMRILRSALEDGMNIEHIKFLASRRESALDMEKSLQLLKKEMNAFKQQPENQYTR